MSVGATGSVSVVYPEMKPVVVVVVVVRVVPSVVMVVVLLVKPTLAALNACDIHRGTRRT